MTRFLRMLFHYAVPRFTTFYYLMPEEGDERIVWVLNSLEDVAEEYRDRVVCVSTFLFLGRPYFSHYTRP